MGLFCCCCRIVETQEDQYLQIKNDHLKPLHNIPEVADESIYTALYSYTPTSVEEIVLNVGDKILMLEDEIAGKNWYKATNLVTSHTGLVPITYLGRNLERELWWFPDTNLVMAENLLLWEGNSNGSFLIRPSKGHLTPYALSVRTTDEKNQPIVKHYKINYENGSYFISDFIKASNLHNLINSYILANSESLGICENLSYPCARVNPQLYEIGHECFDKIELDHKELELETTPFAAGNFSHIFKAKWRGRTVAVKIPKDTNTRPNDFMKEVKIMKSLRHKNILTLYGVCTTLNRYYIVLEYMELGSLLEYTKKNKMLHAQRIYVAMQIASAMAFLESHKVIHRDLAARNVLLMDRLCVKLSDFGLSHFLANAQEYSTSNSTVMPIIWMAPECIQSGYSTKSDVWSFAILLMEIYTNGARPYSELLNSSNYSHAMLFERLRTGYVMKRVSDLPSNIYNLMLKCWNLEPNMRPCFLEIEAFFMKYEIFEGSNLYE